jgi:hypothetical protein
MSYVFKWKRRFFWQKQKVIGHRYETDQDKMVLYLDGGSIREIRNWVNCELYLGQDWILAVKKDAESKSGTTIPLSVG